MNRRFWRELIVETCILVVAAWQLSVAFGVGFNRTLAGLGAVLCISILVMRMLLRRRSVGGGGTELPVPTMIFEAQQPKRDEWRA